MQSWTIVNTTEEDLFRIHCIISSMIIHLIIALLSLELLPRQSPLKPNVVTRV